MASYDASIVFALLLHMPMDVHWSAGVYNSAKAGLASPALSPRPAPWINMRRVLWRSREPPTELPTERPAAGSIAIMARRRTFMLQIASEVISGVNVNVCWRPPPRRLSLSLTCTVHTRYKVQGASSATSATSRGTPRLQTVIYYPRTPERVGLGRGVRGTVRYALLR